MSRKRATPAETYDLFRKYMEGEELALTRETILNFVDASYLRRDRGWVFSLFTRTLGEKIACSLRGGETYLVFGGGWYAFLEVESFGKEDVPIKEIQDLPRYCIGPSYSVPWKIRPRRGITLEGFQSTFKKALAYHNSKTQAFRDRVTRAKREKEEFDRRNAAVKATGIPLYLLGVRQIGSNWVFDLRLPPDRDFYEFLADLANVYKKGLPLPMPENFGAIYSRAVPRPVGRSPSVVWTDLRLEHILRNAGFDAEVIRKGLFADPPNTLLWYGWIRFRMPTSQERPIVDLFVEVGNGWAYISTRDRDVEHFFPVGKRFRDLEEVSRKIGCLLHSAHGRI